ncbi:Os01g0929934 [Oryza sativa Japonica Group]|uniref:Os01g0929934 protein n=1 Tax=Oryza sativa subsp. japonica TaxID=39947 RepID=A0A0P0VCK4_ORYSJ|nr:Os01g0929934 [Oryza sativa Japonica Group]
MHARGRRSGAWRLTDGLGLCGCYWRNREAEAARVEEGAALAPRAEETQRRSRSRAGGSHVQNGEPPPPLRPRSSSAPPPQPSSPPPPAVVRKRRTNKGGREERIEYGLGPYYLVC